MKNIIIFILILVSPILANAQSQLLIESDDESDSTVFVEGNNRYFNYPTKYITYFYFDCNNKLDTLKFTDRFKNTRIEPTFIIPISLKLVIKQLILSGCLITIDVRFNTTDKTIRYYLNNKEFLEKILN